MKQHHAALTAAAGAAFALVWTCRTHPWTLGIIIGAVVFVIGASAYNDEAERRRRQRSVVPPSHPRSRRYDA